MTKLKAFIFSLLFGLLPFLIIYFNLTTKADSFLSFQCHETNCYAMMFISFPLGYFVELFIDNIVNLGDLSLPISALIAGSLQWFSIVFLIIYFIGKAISKSKNQLKNRV